MSRITSFAFGVLAVATAAQTKSVRHPPSAIQTTAFDRGPDGLEAWTDDHHTKQFRSNTEPSGIVITKHGKRVRYIGEKDGGPFFWNLMLLPGGKRIAYEHGPFHFAMTCTLMDIRSGKHLKDIACFSDTEIDEAPQWAKDLLQSVRKPSPDWRRPSTPN